MADQYAVFALGAGIFGVEDTSAAVTNPDGSVTHTVAAFDGPRASAQVTLMLNLGALPPTAMVWESITTPPVGDPDGSV